MGTHGLEGVSGGSTWQVCTLWSVLKIAFDFAQHSAGNHGGQDFTTRVQERDGAQLLRKLDNCNFGDGADLNLMPSRW